MGATVLLVAKSIQFSLLLQWAVLLQMSSETELSGRDVEAEQPVEVQSNKEVNSFHYCCRLHREQSLYSLFAALCVSLFQEMKVERTIWPTINTNCCLQPFYSCNLTYHSKAWGLFFMFLKVPYAHQGCIYFIKSKVLKLNYLGFYPSSFDLVNNNISWYTIGYYYIIG